MARARTTSDVFNAIAEPRRREIIEFLADGKSRAVAIVSVTMSDPLWLYRLEPKQLKPVHDWVKHFERFWSHQIDRRLSVFYKNEAGQMFHTYSAYARGLDILLGTYNYLDRVPKGRDESGFAMPIAWVRHRDRYENGPRVSSCGCPE